MSYTYIRKKSRQASKCSNIELDYVTGRFNACSVSLFVYSGSADIGSNFRIDSCQYVYNLDSSALGAGTYRE
jgi:hypothetical protein